MQVVVILTEIEDELDLSSFPVREVHGVYVDLKAFYDEAKEKGYVYDNENQCWTTIDDFGDKIFFIESVHNLNGENNG